MAALQYSKSKIQVAKADYEKKIAGAKTERVGITFLKEYPERVILLSDTLEEPTLDNLWNYLSHFYDKVTPAFKEQFSFEDLAGIYTGDGITRLFAVCTRYVDIDGLRYCQKEDTYAPTVRKKIEEQTLRSCSMAQTQYGVEPAFTAQYRGIRYFALEL